MAKFRGSGLGKVASIWRYPVKSMIGEELQTAEVTATGLVGDRVLALIDRETGKVASAKNPRLWPNFFVYSAAYLSPSSDARSQPVVRINLPDGQAMTSDDPQLEQQLSTGLGRAVRIQWLSDEIVTSQGYWPDFEWLENRDEVFEFPLPQGTFFDGMTIHLLTTATLECLRAASPESRFDVARFRPNFVIETPDGCDGFVEDNWIGKNLSLGEVTFHIERPCPRCVMTTLSQGNLPKDPGVLRTVVQRHAGNVGVYATVVTGGQVRCGDIVRQTATGQGTAE